MENQLQFVRCVLPHKILLNRTNTPSVNSRKRRAISAVKLKLSKEFGVWMTESQVMKKINNMKAKIRKKIEEEKEVIFNGWEKEFYDYMTGENPSPM
jgi:hypothetical protein